MPKAAPLPLSQRGGFQIPRHGKTAGKNARIFNFRGGPSKPFFQASICLLSDAENLLSVRKVRGRILFDRFVWAIAAPFPSSGKAARLFSRRSSFALFPHRNFCVQACAGARTCGVSYIPCVGRFAVLLCAVVFGVFNELYHAFMAACQCALSSGNRKNGPRRAGDYAYATGCGIRA